VLASATALHRLHVLDLRRNGSGPAEFERSFIKRTMRREVLSGASLDRPALQAPPFLHLGETDISLTSRPNSDLRDTAQTVAVSREDNLLC
jgi:hypothetical protein